MSEMTSLGNEPSYSSPLMSLHGDAGVGPEWMLASFEQHPLSIIHLDRHGLILLANQSFAKLIGSLCDELSYARPLQDFLVDGYRDVFEQALVEVDNDRRRTLTIECQLRHRSCALIWGAFHLAGLQVEGSHLSHHVLLAITPIDDYKAQLSAANELRTRQKKLQRVDRAKDEFFAVLAHELRTPLNVILGYIELLKKYDEHAVDWSDALNAIERSALTQVQLVGDLLEVSKIISGKIPYHPQVFRPKKMLEDALGAIRPAAAAKRIELEVDLPIDEAHIEGDPRRFHQVISNLLNNAIKFTPVLGRVRMRAHEVGELLEIKVIDSGIGVSPRFLDQVFDRFWQEGVASDDQEQGMGLGLAIVKHLIQMHKGRVWAESAGRGHGSTFVIQLPLASCTEERERLASDEATP